MASPTQLFEDALIRHKSGDLRQAARLYRLALCLDPAMVTAFANLGHAMQGLGRHGDAIAAIGNAVRIAPDNAELHYNLGNAQQAAILVEPAEQSYRAALRLRPDFAAALHNLGTLQNESGRPNEALAAFERALELDPASADAWFNRSDLVRFAKGDAAIGRMEALLARSRGQRERTLLHFALGKAWMDAGDGARAFSHFDEGNRLKRATLAYALDADLAKMREAARPVNGATLSSDLPVFIIGMPRSGTTLVEQILASHPAMFGAGELKILPDLVESGESDIGSAYLERIGGMASGKLRIIDKLPGNFLYAGLVAGARIIHCRRDPVDTCLSCYTKLFTDGQDFTYDQRELGLYYLGYAGLMEHWRSVLPRFIEINYEDVVSDLEGAARKLVAFCGLDWDAACLSFHQTQRPIRTASVNQVRQPIHGGSVGRWKAYAPYLQPLLSALSISSNGADQSPGRV